MLCIISNGMDNEQFSGNIMPGQGESSVEASVEGGLPAQAGKKFKMPSKKIIYIIVVVAAVGGLLFYFKSLFVVASVNGSFISKSSFVQEMEKQSGQQALDALIVTKLIENKVKNITVTKDDVDAAVKKIDDQLKTQGTTLAEALKARNMSNAELVKQVTLQEKLRKLFADKTGVTDEEITKYMKDNKVTVPKGTDPNVMKDQISQSLSGQKLNTEIQKLIDTMKSEAKINYFIKL